jgi:hypothetical protein
MIKYYLYISDTKVDMLYAQIPQSIRAKIAAEIKIDLKVLSVTFKDKDAAKQETRYSKLKLVNSYIEKHLGVGSLENPASYFKGIIPMRWTQLQDAAYFGGQDSNFHIGLCGSACHLTEQSIPKQGSRYSTSFGAWQFFKQFMAHNVTPETEETNNALLKGLLKIDDSDNERMFKYMNNVYRNLEKTPLQNLEFLARILFEGREKVSVDAFSDADRTTILATPIYVALAD